MISLQFATGADLGALAIMWFGGGPQFSHVDSVLPDGRLLGARSDLIGGAPAGVQVRSDGYLGSERVLRIDLPVDTSMSGRYYDFVQAQIGKPYDKEGILGFIAGRTWDDPSAWFCSELVAAGLEECGFFKLKLAASANKITPADLILLLSALVPVTL